MKERLTDKELEAYCFMRDFMRENDQLPPSRAIGRHFGQSERNGHYVVKMLENKGWIEKNSVGNYRFAREAA